MIAPRSPAFRTLAPRSAARRLALAGLVALPLAACGNNPEQQANFTLLRTLGTTALAPLTGGEPPRQAAATPQEIAAALQQVPAERGVIRTVLLTGDQSALAIETGLNRGARTFQTLTGQSFTFRDGVLIQTRGLGYDLMSSSLNGADRLITGRRSGAVQRIYRFLDGENAERDLPVRCRIASEGGETITLVSGRSYATTRMRETCQAGSLTFNNFYWVTGGGTVVRAHHWAGSRIGEVRVELLRD